MTMLNGTLTAYEPGPKPNPFVCPECGNADLERMALVLVDLDWNRYDYQRTDDKPMFTYGESVWAESSERHKPRMECKRTWIDGYGWHICDGAWDVSFDDFELG